MKIGISKCGCMEVCGKGVARIWDDDLNAVRDSVDIQMMGEALPYTHEYRYLGVWIDDKLSWAKARSVQTAKLDNTIKYWQPVLYNHKLSVSCRVLCLKTMVIPSALFGIEFWGGMSSPSSFAPVNKVFHNCLRHMLGVGHSFPLDMMFRDLGVVSVQDHMALQMMRFVKRVWPRDNGDVVSSLNTWGRKSLERRENNSIDNRSHNFYRRVHGKAERLMLDWSTLSRGTLNEEFAARLNMRWLNDIAKKPSLRDFSAMHSFGDNNPVVESLPATLGVSPYLEGSSHMRARRQATKFRSDRLPLNSYKCHWNPPAQAQAPRIVAPEDYYKDACLLCAISLKQRGISPIGAPAETASHTLWECPCLSHHNRRKLNRAAATAFATDGRQYFCPSSTSHHQALHVWHGFAPQKKTQCLMWLFSLPHCASVSNSLMFAFGELLQERNREQKRFVDD